MDELDKLVKELEDKLEEQARMETHHLRNYVDGAFRFVGGLKYALFKLYDYFPKYDKRKDKNTFNIPFYREILIKFI